MSLDEPGLPTHAFIQLLESPALEPDAVRRFRGVMAREGVDQAALATPGAQAPLRWFREVYPGLDADQAVGLGYACGQLAQLTSYGPFSLPLLSAGSIAEVMELLTYLPLISSAISAQFHPGDEYLAVSLTGLTGDPDLDCLVVTYAGSALLQLIRILAGDTSGISVHLKWPAPPSWAQHEDVLAGCLVFEAPITFIQVPNATLEEVCRFSDPIAYRHAMADLRHALEGRIQSKTFSARIRSMLDAAPGLRSSQAVADELAISPSTLKRRLAAEGTTFRELLEASLQERAILRLLDRSVSVGEIASGLGYSDLTNFSHAFKRWTGQSPTRYRETYQDA